jgi:transposase
VTTLLAGLCCTGITAPCVFNGAINGERFRAYVEQMLAPTLWPDDIVVLDNLASHKVACIEEAIAAQGARLIYLPPYSSDLDPIEQAFAKFKAALRKAAERTSDAFVDPRYLSAAAMPQLLYPSRLCNLIGKRLTPVCFVAAIYVAIRKVTAMTPKGVCPPATFSRSAPEGSPASPGFAGSTMYHDPASSSCTTMFGKMPAGTSRHLTPVPTGSVVNSL